MSEVVKEESLRCPEGHAMVRCIVKDSVPPEHLAVCDDCVQPMTDPEAAFYRCATCNFDICQSCAAKRAGSQP